MRQERKSKESGRGFFVLAHNIRSLYNVGAVFRTAACFGVDKVYLSGYTGTPPALKIAKTALGAEKLVAWEYKKSPAAVIRVLRQTCSNLQVLGLENNLPAALRRQVVKLDKFQATFPILLILGRERSGISKRLLKYCGKFLEIPMLGKKKSLNLAVAFGVAAFYLSLRRR